MALADDSDIDRLVDLITERVRARLRDSPGASAHPSGGSVALHVLPRDRGPCNDDSDEDCASCGACVVRRPWAVRALEQAGAERVGAPQQIGGVETGIAGMIDHTLLKPEATRADIVAVCEEARQHRFASVCVNTTWVPLVRSLLGNSSVKVCAVVGFPLGAMTPTAKAYEAREAVRQGAQEIDMVINIGALKSRDYETVYEDICRVVKAAAPAGVKVILECSALDDDQKIIGCSLAKLAGAAFVKTSTGFGKGGATVDDVTLMRRIVGPKMGVKASGGVRTADQVKQMAAAGATRIGASASVAIASGGDSKSSGSGY
ncbi:deoxyribose-phosphate aldolase [Haliangium ochraceum]|uniref:Deoxyribose-phosphate aldolase n=1 Tax=Haliangium ochraceum (strain DSM 14365 / JCM 11303 / SMP-2) TaxID=502025 RepID=D0LL74_HALO1|nr:deoxyribose-phosphate aldolase [Haliangium ochraceum]ACY18570.1 deoxyribose-phosphate aldolase [Haliangium ochraceum DSM 14365]